LASPGSTCSGSSEPGAPASLPAVADSSESTQRRSCSGGCTPWKLEIGCPAATATTVGTACTPKICATLGAASTFTLASDHLPVSAAARTARASASCADASLRGDHNSTTTGTSSDRANTSASKFASVISTPA